MPKITRQQYIQLFLLTILAFALRCYMATLDPFLHEWDEQYHALVARNMMDNPLVPMLRAGHLMPYNYEDWGGNIIWLHKQPLFMWQMALSMKIFGVSLFAMRLPSIILGTMMVPLLYHISRNLNTSHFTAITAAAMHCCCFIHLEMVGGYTGMDHNDVAFSFYILASIWAYSKYTHNEKWSWAVAVGVFVGCAILCKWLTGLIVYSGWGIALCLLDRKDFVRKSGHMLLSVATAAVIAVPWQLYILARFPREAAHEFALNNRHLNTAVEGHGGTWSYYFDFFPQYFGDTICWMIPVGMILILCSKQVNRRLGIGLCIMFAIEVSFFSFIAATKLQSFIMPVVPLGYLMIAFAADKILFWIFQRWPRVKVGLSVAVLLLFCNLTLQWGTMQGLHPDDMWGRKAAIANNVTYKNLSKYLRPGTSVVINVPERDDVKCMFYNKGLQAHSWSPKEEEMTIYTSRALRIGYFRAPPGSPVPDYVRNYWNAYEIPIKLE